MAADFVIGLGEAPERDRALLLIGHAAQAGAQLEFRLALLTAALLALPQRTGIFMLGRESPSRLFGTLRKIVTAIDDAEAKEQVGDWVKRAQAGYERRNGIIHSHIGHDKQTGRLYWTRLTNQLQGFGWHPEAVDMDNCRPAPRALQGVRRELDGAANPSAPLHKNRFGSSANLEFRPRLGRCGSGRREAAAPGSATICCDGLSATFDRHWGRTRRRIEQPLAISV